jgi:hypothetical protein
MKQLALLALLFSAAVLCTAQYKQTGGYGDFKDITGYCTGTTNCWYHMPGGCLVNSLSIGEDGELVCLGTDNNNYSYNPNTRVWNLHNEWGTGNKSFAVQDTNDIYILGPNGPSWATCQASGHGSMSILKWNGTSLVGIQGCLNQISAGPDGSIGGVNYLNNGYVWPAGASGWTQVTGTGWTQLYVSDKNNFCGVKSGVLYVQSGNATTPTAFSPSPGTITGCVYSAFTWGSAASDLMVWGSFGVKDYNFHTNTWSTVYGLTPNTMTSAKKGGVFATDSSHNVYHYNVMAPHAIATMAGSLNKCPTNTCPPGAQHKVSSHIYYPHGVAGYLATQTGSPTTQISATSEDYAPRCDPFFGDPTSSECDPSAPTIDNSALCLFSGQILTNDGLPMQFNGSIDAKSYDGTVLYTYTEPTPGGILSTAVCSATKNACKPGTVATCPIDEFAVEQSCLGDATKCVPSVNEEEAAQKCPLGDAPNAWVAINLYVPGVPNSCIYGFGPDPVMRPEAYLQVPCD